MIFTKRSVILKVSIERCSGILWEKLHRVITNRFKEEFSYSKKGEKNHYKNISYDEMIRIVSRVYRDMPELRKIALNQVRRTYKYSKNGIR